MNISLNIVELIENNPITKLSNTYNGKLLNKIQDNFSGFEQQLFVTSFYCYLNCDQKKDFVIDLDNVWQWLGFNQKSAAKRVLEKNFVIDCDYKVLLTKLGEQKNTPGSDKDTRGGHNKECIMMTIKAFKSFCLKTGTKKADEIHEYYMKLEEIIQDVIQEESDELKIQLENTNALLKQETIKNENTKCELQHKLAKTDNDKVKLREKTILEQFPPNTQCVYYGIIDNLSDTNELLIKFGNSNNLRNRVTTHKETYENFRLNNAFKVGNKCEIENAIKNNPIFSSRMRSITIKGKKYVELLNINGMTYHEIDSIIIGIIKSNECNPENYQRLIDENRSLKKQLAEKNNIDNTNKLTIATTDNERLTRENTMLFKKLKKMEHKITSWKSIVTTDEYNSANIELPYEENTIPININIIKELKRPHKQNDGTYNIKNQIYNKLFGTRQEVWDEVSYKTSGGLCKSDLLMNPDGKIVSLSKSIYGKTNNRLDQINMEKKNKSAQSTI